MGWAHRWKPPQGEGHGGPAKGGGDKPAQPFTDTHQPPGLHLSIGKMEAKEYRERLRAKLAAVADAYDAALVSENIGHRLMAAKQIEDRVFGQAKQIVETQEDTRTAEEIKAEIERKRREAGLD